MKKNKDEIAIRKKAENEARKLGVRFNHSFELGFLKGYKTACNEVSAVFEELNKIDERDA